MAHIKTLSKAALGTVIAGAMLTATATPAAAQWGDRNDRRGDGISAGEVIAGAVILGGLAAILSSGDNDRDRYDERTDGYGYDNQGYNYNRNGGNARAAVNQCVSAVQQRLGYNGQGSRVDQITNIDRTGSGYKVEGRITVNDRYGNGYGNNGYGNNGYSNNGYGNRGDDRYDNRYDQRRYGNDDRYGNGYDTGSFSCTVKYGRVDKLKVRGV